MNWNVFMLCALGILLLFGIVINIYDTILTRIRYDNFPLLGKDFDFSIKVVSYFDKVPSDNIIIYLSSFKNKDESPISSIDRSKNISYYINTSNSLKKAKCFFKKVILKYALKNKIYICSDSRFNRNAYIYATAAELALIGKSKYYNALNKKEQKEANKISKIFFEVG